jgi:aminoglycoside phosphotransferase (APT) family kinase protein
MSDIVRGALAQWLGEQMGRVVEVAELRRIATGNSRAMWYVELAGGERFVARVEQGGVFGTSSADEYRFMQAASQLGCPVAAVRWLEPTGSVIGQPFFVMDFLDGAATARDDRAMSAELADDFVTRLHELHCTDWARELPSDLRADGAAAEATHRQVDRWLQVYRDAAPLPVPLLEEGAAWLHHHAPACRSVGIVHGDPGPGNFVHDGRRVLAFTDWEFTHLGDPTEDWAYLVSMRGARTMGRDQWLSLFRKVAGVELTEDDLRYWSIFNFFKGACANLTCLAAFRTTNPAPNMVLIGTALHQTYVRQTAGLIEEATSCP